MSVLGWLTGRHRTADAAVKASSDQVTADGQTSGPAGGGPSAAALALGAGAVVAGGTTGASVKIGIVSDSFDALGTAGADEASGALPATVQVLSDSARGRDEGRAMAEVAHAVAPGAAIAFSAADGSVAGLAASIAALQAAGCSVICDDVTYADEPFFQVGDAAEKAISAFTAAGGVYFTDASNAGPDSAYQNGFSGMAADLPGVGAVTAMNFGTAAAPQTADTLRLAAGHSTTLDLQWAQPWASIDGQGSAYSLAFALYDPSGDLVKTFAQDCTGGDPVQSGTFTPTVSGVYTVAVWVNGGTDPGGTFKIVANNSASDTAVFGGAPGSASIFGHNDDPQAITVGAASTPALGGTLRPESFSAAGPGEALYSAAGVPLRGPKLLNGVAVSGPDGVTTTVASPGLSPFYGTSCATPAVAAVGALMKEADPSLDAGEVRSLIEASALPFGDAAQAGSGLAQAGPAVALARESDTTLRDDFYGDGQTALLWQDGRGGAEVSRVADDAVAGTAALAGALGAGWTAEASGDFSGVPGRAGLVWQDGAGAIAVTAVTGSSAGARTALGDPGAGWTVAGTGDFGGDGNSDILLEDAAGEAQVWTTEGAKVTARTPLAGPGAGWSVAGIGDLDGDGRSDVVWQDGSGDVALWIMQGTSVASELQLAGPGAGWSVAGVGDMTGDGRADVLFQDAATGSLDLWTMDGTSVLAKTAISGGPGAGWTAAGVGAFDPSGRDGILFEDAATGGAEIAGIRHGRLGPATAVSSPGAGWSVKLG